MSSEDSFSEDSLIEDNDHTGEPLKIFRKDLYSHNTSYVLKSSKAGQNTS